MANSSSGPEVVPMKEGEIRPKDLESRQKLLFLRDISRAISRYDEFVGVSCPACSSSESRFRFFKIAFRFVECTRCQTLYMTPRPSKALMKSYYENSENYRYWATEIFPLSEISRKTKIAQPALDRVLSICEERNVARNLLVEVGPGFGTFLDLAQNSRRFAQVLGVEPTPDLAQACRERGLHILEKAIEDLERHELTQVDVLVAFEVIEHLFDPQEFLSSMRRILATNGILVLSFPSSSGFDISLLGEHSDAIDLEHVNLFNPYSIDILLRETGFQLVECFSPGRLDVELVRKVGNDLDLDFGRFLNGIIFSKSSLILENFQRFLAENCLSSHLWVVAEPTDARDDL